LFRVDYVVGAVLLIAIWPRLAWQDVVTDRAIAAQTRGWETVGEWARTTTPASAVFLIPTKHLDGETTPPATTAGSLVPDPTQNSEIFEFASHRRVWVDFRRGAAVLWTPSYYATWWTRVSEVLALHSLADKVAYAQEHDIDYVIEACRNSPDLSGTAIFQTDGLCVYSAVRGRSRSPGS
jgi:hypothetical protein